MRMHVAAENRLWTLNTPVLPAGVDDAALRKRLLEEFSIEVLGGFGPLTGKVLRVGLMGRLVAAQLRPAAAPSPGNLPRRERAPPAPPKPCTRAADAAAGAVESHESKRPAGRRLCYQVSGACAYSV